MFNALKFLVIFFISATCMADNVFVAEKACTHGSSIKNAQKGGEPYVEVGKSYQIISFNSASKEYVRIKVDGFGDRWVRSDCGFSNGQASSSNDEKRFDYYKLSISYSPEFCNASNDLSMLQCKREWVVHGLWPQYFDGGYPSSCTVDNSYIDAIDDAHILTYLGGENLISHEWSNHGTCSGLKRSEYFYLTETLWKKVRLPKLTPGAMTASELSELISTSTEGLSPDMIELACDESPKKPDASDDTFDELRVCFNKTGEFTRCTHNEISCSKLHEVKIRALN